MLEALSGGSGTTAVAAPVTAPLTAPAAAPPITLVTTSFTLLSKPGERRLDDLFFAAFLVVFAAAFLAVPDFFVVPAFFVVFLLEDVAFRADALRVVPAARAPFLLVAADFLVDFLADFFVDDPFLLAFAARLDFLLPFLATIDCSLLSKRAGARK
jgi:hypothetical protein